MPQYQIRHIYEKKVVGEPFIGTCAVCNTKLEVKVLKSLDRSTLNSYKIGPFDRLCAYEHKIGNIDIYETYPQNILEVIHRKIFKSEMPVQKAKIYTSLSRLLIFVLLVLFILYINYQVGLILVSKGQYSVFFSVSVLVIISLLFVGLYFIIFPRIPFMFELYHQYQKKLDLRNKLFQEFENSEFISFFLQTLLFSILFMPITLGALASWFIILYIILNIITMILVYTLPLIIITLLGLLAKPEIIKNSVYIVFRNLKRVFVKDPSLGGNYIKNYDLFWDGKIYLNDRDVKYYPRMGILQIILFISLYLPLGMIANPINSNISNRLYYQSFLDYLNLESVHVVILVLYFFSYLIIQPLIFIPKSIFLQYYAVPDDIFNLKLQRNEVTEDKFQIKL